jgi:hypothetical protein
MSIACVAIIGKDNDPLYLRTFASNNPSSANSPSSVPFAPSSIHPTQTGPLNWNNDQGLKFHYLVHTSLDNIEEKTNRSKKAAAAGGAGGSATSVTLPGDLYLGLLFTVEEYKLYGYTTNTKVKFVVVLQDCSQEVNLKQWMRDLHTLYLATVCNPFSDLGTAIQNPTFEQNVGKLVAGWFYVERK